MGWDRMDQKKISKKRNGLPPAGLADLDPWVWEQTKEQAKSWLKDNTIQKVSMQTQHVFVHKHISKIATFSRSCSSYSIFVLTFIISYMSHYLAFLSHLYMKHLQTYNVPGTVLGVGNADKSKTGVLPSGSVSALWLLATWEKWLYVTNLCIAIIWNRADQVLNEHKWIKRDLH